MRVGELLAEIGVDDQDWTRGLASAETKFDGFGSDVDRGLAELEREFAKASMDMLAKLDRALGQIDDEARAAMNDAAREVERGAQRMARELEQAGDSGGAGLLSKVKAAGPGIVAALAAAGAAAGAALVAGLEKHANMEKANDKLAAQLALTEEESASIGASAGALYALAYGDSLEDVNEAIRGVISNIGGMRTASSEDLEAVTAKVIDLSSAFEQDLGAVSRAVGKMLKTGLAKDATEALDILTRGFQTGANEADDLLETFSEYSTMFRDIGIDGATAMGLISQGLKAGARDADTVADALKEFAIRAQDNAKESIAGFQALGLNGQKMTAIFAKGGPEAAKALDVVLDRLRNMKDPVERNGTAVALFGTKAEDLADSLFALDPSAAVGALGEVSGAAKTMGDTLAGNSATAWESFKRTVEMNFINFMGAHVIPLLNSLSDRFTTTFGPIVEVVRAALAAIFEGGGVEAPAWAQPLIDMAAKVGEGFQKIWSVISEKLWPIFAEFVPKIMPIVEFFGGILIDTVVTAVEGVVNALSGAFGIIGGLIDFFSALFTGDWEGLWQAVKDIGQSIWDLITGALQLFFSGGLGKIFKWGYDFIAGLVKKGWDWIKGLFDDAWRMLKDAVKGGVDKLLDWLGGFGGWILDKIGDLGKLLWRQGEKIIEGLWEGLKAAWRKVTGWISDIAGWIADNKGPIEYDRKLLVPAGKAIMQGLLAGMQSQQGVLLNYLHGLTDAISVGGSPTASFGVAGGFSLDRGSGTFGGQSSGALLNIERASFDREQSPDQIADALAWKLSMGGRR